MEFRAPSHPDGTAAITGAVVKALIVGVAGFNPLPIDLLSIKHAVVAVGHQHVVVETTVGDGCRGICPQTKESTAFIAFNIAVGQRHFYVELHAAVIHFATVHVDRAAIKAANEVAHPGGRNVVKQAVAQIVAVAVDIDIVELQNGAISYDKAMVIHTASGKGMSVAVENHLYRILIRPCVRVNSNPTTSIIIAIFSDDTVI